MTGGHPPAGARVAAVFGSSRIGPEHPDYAVSMEMGRLLGEAGWTVATGGHDGAMAAVSRGARDAGAHVVGVTLPGPQGRSPNAWVAEERPARDLFARLAMLLDADAWIAVAGGVGTLAEIAVAWNLMQNAHVAHRPLVLVGEGWARVVDAMRGALVVDAADLTMVTCVPDPAAAMSALGPRLPG
ncbi:MAG: LOG family protein [Thermoleophilia bacterium]|nr:LOG family protein [Thermoleophilia bacterium]